MSGTDWAKAYPVQHDIDITTRIDDCLLASQLHDLTKDPNHAFVLELLEMGGHDAWRLGVVHCLYSACSLGHPGVQATRVGWWRVYEMRCERGCGVLGS